MIREHTIFYNENDNYNGIFKYISNEYNENNILSANLVRFSAIDIPTDSHNNFEVILGINNEDRSTYFITRVGIENPWFQVDFLRNQVVTYGYFYRANAKDFFEHFELLGSNDQENWETLDSRNDEYSDYDNSMKDVYFECNQKIYLPFRYLRLQTHGPRGYEQPGLAIFGLEIYGSIRPIKVCTKDEQIITFHLLFTCIYIFI